MHKLLLILAIVLLSLPASAADINKTLTAEWQQLVEDYPKIASWALYWSDSPTAGFAQCATIDHPDDGPLAEAEVTLTVSGQPGTTVKKYFFLTAWSRADGKETGPSNVASFDFAIPQTPVMAPSQFTIRVKIQ